jgi:sugar/nucleoside kinase (ribokinase family)
MKPSGTQMSEDVVTFDRLGREVLLIGASGDDAFGDHEATTASRWETG